MCWGREEEEEKEDLVPIQDWCEEGAPREERVRGRER